MLIRPFTLCAALAIVGCGSQSAGNGSPTDFEGGAGGANDSGSAADGNSTGPDAGAPDATDSGTPTADGGTLDAAGDSGSCGPARIASSWGCDVDWLNPPGDLVDSAPIVLDGTTGKVIENVRINGAPGNAITLKNCKDIVIQNVELLGADDNGIRIENCDNVTVRNSYIHDSNTGQHPHSGYAVFEYHAGNNNVIAGNWFEDCAGGLRVELSSDAQGLVLRNNFHKNPHHVPNQGSQGQLAIFAYTGGLVSALVTENVSIATLGKAFNEDHINFFRSGGTAASPVMVTHNRIRGNAGSRSSCGIILGDTGTSPTSPNSAYVTADSNILVDPAAAGLCLTGGHDFVFTNNRVFASRNSSDIADMNVGVAVWRQKGQPGSMYNDTIGGKGQENQVLWWSDFMGTGTFNNAKYFPSTGDDKLTPNHGTLAQGNIAPKGWADNDFNHTAWDQSGGNAGYGALWNSDWDHWSHYPGP